MKQTREMRWVLALAIAALTLVGLGGVAGRGARSLVFPAPPPRAIEPLAGGRVVTFALPAHETGFALHHPAPPGAPTVVYFHGNGDQVAYQVELGRMFASRGLGLYAVEYPGYGPASDQAVSETAIYTAADAALTHLRDALGVPNERIVLMGQSLGTGVAAEMATRGFGARLVLLSPYTSIPDLAAQKLSSLARGVILDVFDTKAKAPSVARPVLIAHGAGDTLIPIEMARELDALFPRSELLVMPGAGHNDVWQAGGDAWLERLGAFARGDGGPP